MDINNFCVQITGENVEEVQKWWKENNGGDKAWTIGAYYGRVGGQLDAGSQKEDINSPIISYEEFQQYVLGNVVETYTLY